MEEIIFKDFLTDKDKFTIFSVDELKQGLGEISIDSIEVDDGEIWRMKDEILTFFFNDYEHPIVLKKDNIFNKNKLYINPDWYLENRELCDNLVRYICSNVNSKVFSIDSSILIDSNLIDALCLNKVIEKVSLGAYDKKIYSLTKDDYLKFKNSSILEVETNLVDKELEDVFDDLIWFNMNKKLVSSYNYRRLQTTDKLYISEELKDFEIANLKYIPDGVSIKFSEKSYRNIDKVIEELKKLDKHNKIILDINNKEKFNNYWLNNKIEYDNLKVLLGLDEYSIQDYLKFERKLYEMVSGAKDLSLFEKYIYAYNATKSFKKYKENEEDLKASRNLYSVLINDYMVCVGFSKMFGDLLNKLGISNSDLGITVDVSYDGVELDRDDFREVKSIEYGGHARRYVHIVDDKYGIDGFYVADPTWDNDLENDYYNNLAMTNNEVLSARRYLKNNIHDASELFYINSIEEYIEKINFLISRKNNKKGLNEIIDDLINRKLNKLDFKYVEFLKEKYDFLSKGYFNWPSDINELVYDVGNYLVNHVNKEIPGEVIIEAVSNVYRKAYSYSEEELEVKMKEIIEINKIRQSKSFPVRYNVGADGSREVINEVKNKFDIEYSGKVR